jgi:inosine/guanosine/xanthosine phosphorylase family protein
MTEVSLAVPEADVRRVLEACARPPKVAIILGSGLASLADRAEDAVVIPHSEFEGVPKVGPVAGHAGSIVVGTIGGVSVLLFQGRAHQYQGVSALDAAYPARLAAAVGCEVLIVTNASGGVAHHLAVGDLILIADHLNLMGTSPLTGWPGPEGGVPFIPMRDAYDCALRALMREVASEQGVGLREGVYAALLGPSYETEAEVDMLRGLGADVVGMSTVPETIAARALGLRVLGLSLVTNVAAGFEVSHEQVLESGIAATERLQKLMIGFVSRL